MRRHRLPQLLLVLALTVVVGLTSVTSYGGPLVLCFALGDHHHLLIDRQQGGNFCHTHGVSHEPGGDFSHRHHHPSRPACQHGDDHHPADTDAVSESHEHYCIDITLSGGDSQPPSRKAAASPDQADAPPSLVCHGLTLAPSATAGYGRGVMTHKWSPPDLLRSTILLI